MLKRTCDHAPHIQLTKGGKNFKSRKMRLDAIYTVLNFAKF